MKSDNYEVSYCVDDNENRMYCDICDKLCIERYYKNNLKSQTHTNYIRERKIISNNFSKLNVDVSS